LIFKIISYRVKIVLNDTNNKMKIRKITALVTSSLLVFIPLLAGFLYTAPTPVYAATSPSLGEADSFVILSTTYTNTVGGTTLTGDLGYTTGPATAPTVNGTTYSPPSSKYSTAGTDQGSALTNINGQACTHTFPLGAVDLATDTSHGTIGVYTPGVYCTGAASAASIGAGGITLSGSGTYIFKIDGALTTDANSVVTLSGASSCDVFWAPTAATTLGANSTFVGTNIDDAGITIGSTVTWTGRALSFAGTVTTDTDTLSVPSCPAPTPTPTSTTTTTSTSTTTTTSSTTDAPVYVCPTITTGVTPPNIIDSRRVNATSIFLGWGPYSGTDRFNIRYGPSNGNWLFNTDVTGFSTTINNLPSNTPMWFQVAARNDCQIGEYGEASLIGGTSSVGFPNTGVPRFPNTGLAPKTNNSLWYPLAGLIFGVSAILISIQRKS